MKKVLLLLIAVSLYSCSSMKPTPVNPEPTSKTFDLSGDKSELYVKANNWMVENFNSAKSVIQFSDKEEGIVTGKYLMGTVRPSSMNNSYNDVYAIIKLQVKDGASKITISPDSYEYITSLGVMESEKITEEKLKNQVNELIASYEVYMKNNNSSDF